MSGLTGYLTANGTDLSYVFMPINTVLSVGNVSLSSNNDFTGTNNFSAGTWKWVCCSNHYQLKDDNHV